MKLIYFSIVCFFAILNLEVNAQMFNNREVLVDTLQPIIDIVPNKIEVIEDSSKFFTTTVKVLNRGGGILDVKSINGSCSCSHGYILSDNIYPLAVGELRLEVNKDGFNEDDDSVLFTVYSNAKNSPFHFTVKFLKKTPSVPKK